MTLDLALYGGILLQPTSHLSGYESYNHSLLIHTHVLFCSGCWFLHMWIQHLQVPISLRISRWASTAWLYRSDMVSLELNKYRLIFG
jgi:hypothetical protein